MNGKEGGRGREKEEKKEKRINGWTFNLQKAHVYIIIVSPGSRLDKGACPLSFLGTRHILNDFIIVDFLSAYSMSGIALKLFICFI